MILSSSENTFLVLNLVHLIYDSYIYIYNQYSEKPSDIKSYTDHFKAMLLWNSMELISRMKVYGTTFTFLVITGTDIL